MSTERVLYESPDISRNDMSADVYGSSPCVETFLRELHTGYDATPLTVYGKKRVVMTPAKHVIVYGQDPIVHVTKGDDVPATFQFPIPFLAILVQKWGSGFYHFVNEMLPKILRIAEYNSKIPILSYYNDTFIKSILAYCGVTNPIVPYDGTKVYAIKSAILVTETASGNPSPSDIDIIRKYAKVADRVVPKDTTVLIYRKEALRSITNFEAVVEELKRQFPAETFVVFNSLPFPDAVELFQRAKLIIAAHGAGLSNLVFGSKKTPVIEMFPANLVNACYWHLSWILENPHYILASPSSGRPYYNLTVELDSLCSLVKRCYES